jgi:hypothetical protein
MRDPERIPLVLHEIEKVWRLHPDWRLGQLLCNLAAWIDTSENIVWDVEDDALLAEARRHVEEQRNGAKPGNALSATAND